MVAIEYRQKSSTTITTTNTVAVLPAASASTLPSNQLQHHNKQEHYKIPTPPAPKKQQLQQQQQQKTAEHNNTNNKMAQENEEQSVVLVERQAVAVGTVFVKGAISRRNIDIKDDKKSDIETSTKVLTKPVLKLELTGDNNELDEYSLKSPKSPIIARLPHQSSLTASVDVEDRKTLRDALYQGIFHRHRRTIFAVGSFLRMLRTRNSQYNVIRSTSEAEDVEEVR